MVICKKCYAPRCGYADEIDPCILGRHHHTDHVTPKGRSWPVGGSEQPLPPEPGED
jgi:hypothetical protein